MMICTLSGVASSVVNSNSDLTVPAWPATSTYWPTLKGRKISSITPAATFDSVPCKARPIARPAAPKTAIRLVVSTPNRFRTAMMTTASTA